MQAGAETIGAQETCAKKAHIFRRYQLDWYVDPRAASEALFHVERFVGRVWDPCCGGGNIVASAIAAGYEAVGTDVVTRAPARAQRWFRGEADFLAWSDPPLAPNIVFNPPFFKGKGAEACIRKALAISTGKVAAFVDLKFLSGGARARGIYSEFPPHRVWVLAPRVSCPPGEYLAAGGKASGGTADWTWLVWDRTAPPPAQAHLSWLIVQSSRGRRDVD